MKYFCKVLIVLLGFTPCIQAQFTTSFTTDLAISLFPNYTAFNDTLQTEQIDTLGHMWIPLSYHISKAVYPSIRVGIMRLSNKLFLLKTKLGSSANPNDVFYYYNTMTGISVESYFTFKKRFEAFFGVAPLYSSSNFFQDQVKVDSTYFDFTTETSAGMKTTYLSYYTWMGLRFYFNTWLGIEAAMGYLTGESSKDGWESNGKKLDHIPPIDMESFLIRFGVVTGW